MKDLWDFFPSEAKLIHEKYPALESPEHYLKLVMGVSAKIVNHMLKGDDVLIGKAPHYEKFEFTGSGLQAKSGGSDISPPGESPKE